MIDLIQQIKAKLSIEDLLQRFGLKTNSSGFIYSIYKQEKTPSLKIYFETNSFYDYSSNTGGDVIKFYQDYTKTDTKTAIRELADILNLTTYRPVVKLPVKPPVKPPEKPPELLKDSKGNVFEEEKYFFDERAGIYEFEGELDRPEAERRAYQDLFFYRQDIKCDVLDEFQKYGSKNIPDKVKNYLLNKRHLTVNSILDYKLFGIDPQQAEEFLRDTFDDYQLRIAGLLTPSNYFIFKKHTCLIPYIENKKIVFMKGRSLGSTRQKYIGLSGITAKRFYNKDILKKTDEILIVEGEFDCILSNKTNPTIAVGGVGNIPDLKILQDKEVYILFDNDTAGNKAGEKLFDEVKELNINVHLLKINTHAKDLTELFNEDDKENY